jgi:hypothetical protein
MCAESVDEKHVLRFTRVTSSVSYVNSERVDDQRDLYWYI